MANRAFFEIAPGKQFQTFGNISEPTQFLTAEQRTALGDKPIPRLTVSDTDARLALDVEVFEQVEGYDGNMKSETHMIRLPDTPENRSAVKPGAISFDGLRATASAYMSGNRAQLRVYYTADCVAGATKRGE